VKNDVKRYRDNLQGEIDGAYLYEALAQSEPDPKLAEVYKRLASVERRHAKVWADKLGVQVPPVLEPGWRTRALGWLSRKLGTQFVLPTVISLEQRDRDHYDLQPEAKAAGLPADEASHARLLQAVAGSRGFEGNTLARFEGRHRAMGGNALRAAVLGVNDGLCSNLSLVMGVAGAGLSSHSILVTGFAGLLACACSMAIGEWLSVQSSRELNRRQIGIEAEEIAISPEEEAEELALIYEAKGLTQSDAGKLAHRLIAEPKSALETLSREELGIDPNELGGSPWVAAAMSFGLSIVGAIFPVAPFAFLEGNTAVLISLAMSSIALFLIGAATTIFTGSGVWYSGGRQLVLGWLAASVTFGIGHLLKVSVAG
jgi:VIT1/CCC1 family predicted Fe2+/Mn2+ transporter